MKICNDDITFQNLTGGIPYTEKPETQSHVYNYAKDNNIKEDSIKEENSGETSTSTNEDQLVHEYVRQPPRSPGIHCSRETLKFMDMSLAKNTAEDSALNPNQPESFLCKECVNSDVENPFYKENSFNQYDQRANYKTEEVRFFMVSTACIVLKDVFFSSKMSKLHLKKFFIVYFPLPFSPLIPFYSPPIPRPIITIPLSISMDKVLFPFCSIPLRHRWQTQGPRAKSGPAPCFYPVSAPSSGLPVKE